MEPQGERKVVSIGESYCGNCGNPVLSKSDVCTSCGANRFAHRNFCHSCGVALNSYQVVCVKCGSRIGAKISVNPPIVGSVIVLLLLPIVGIFSLIFSIQASEAVKKGDYSEAVSKAKTACTINNVFWWIFALLFLGIVLLSTLALALCNI